MIEAHGEAKIAAPVETVFDFLADARNEPQWLPGAQQVEKVTEVRWVRARGSTGSTHARVA